jgi:hypothetical protein
VNLVVLTVGDLAEDSGDDDLAVGDLADEAGVVAEGERETKASDQKQLTKKQLTKKQLIHLKHFEVKFIQVFCLVVVSISRKTYGLKE